MNNIEKIILLNRNNEDSNPLLYIKSSTIMFRTSTLDEDTNFLIQKDPSYTFPSTNLEFMRLQPNILEDSYPLRHHISSIGFNLIFFRTPIL